MKSQKTTVAVIASFILFAIFFLALLKSEQQRRVFQSNNSTFKDGRDYRELAYAGSYDDSAGEAKHRTGRMEGGFDEESFQKRGKRRPNKIATHSSNGKNQAPQQRRFKKPFDRNGLVAKKEENKEKPATLEEKKKSLSKNAYYGSNYVAGGGHLSRLKKQIESGVDINGKEVRLESFIKQYKQNLPKPPQKAALVSVQSSHQSILTKNEGCNVVLQVGIAASDRKMAERLPLNVCLILDRSGSMRRQNKMEFAKQAANQLISMLKPTDYFSLVAYDHAVTTPIPAGRVQNPNALMEIVNNLKPGGSTNIYGGLEAGYREVKKHFSPEFFNCVLLLSDGIANAGPTSPSAIGSLSKKALADGIQTSSLGVGLEFNDKTMLAVASQGHGKYHFIENPELIPALLEEEFRELDSMIAMAVKTRIVLHDKVELVRVLGMYQLSNQEVKAVKQTEQHLDKKLAKEFGIQENRSKKDESGIKFFRNHLLSGEYQLYLLEVRIPAGMGELKIADVEVKYKDLLNASNGVQNNPLTLPYTTEESSFIGSINREVKRNELGYETGYILKEAADLIARGDTFQACKKISSHAQLLSQVGKAYNDGDLLADGELMQKYFETLKPFENQNLARGSVGNYFVKTFNFQGFRRTR